MHPHRVIELVPMRRPVLRPVVRFFGLCLTSFLVVWCASVGLSLLVDLVLSAFGIAGWPKGVAILAAATFGIHQGVAIARGMWRH